MLFFKTFTFWVKPCFWHRLSNYVAKRRRLCLSSWGGNCIWGVGTQEVLPAEIFRRFKDIDFENETFAAFEDVDSYLKGIYGDYMTPPPPEKCVAGHVLSVYLKD